MMATGVESSFDAAGWLTDRALNDGEYLQPQKLHRLLYLAQAYFAVAHRGRPLMPSVFIATEAGPITPDVFRVYAQSRPYVETKPLRPDAELVLDSVWRRFGQHSVDYLTRQIKQHTPYLKAYEKGEGSIIALNDMVAFYGAEAHANQAPGGAPPLAGVLRPRVMRSHTGRPVNVQKWMPPEPKNAQAAKG